MSDLKKEIHSEALLIAEMVPSCLDCEHHEHYPSVHFADPHRCTRSLQDDSLATMEAVSRSCHRDRTGGYVVSRLFGTCGVEGRFHEPIDHDQEIQDGPTS